MPCDAGWIGDLTAFGDYQAELGADNQHGTLVWKYMTQNTFRFS